MHPPLYAIRATAAAVGFAALAALVVTPLTADAYYSPTVTYVTNYDAALQDAHANLDTFWGWNFAHATVPRTYTSPGVSWLNEAGGTTTACGNLEAQQSMQEAAFYCFPGKAMYFDYGFLAGVINANYGWEGVTAAMAHEEGHHVQNLVGVHNATTQQQELQADCLAGAFMRWDSTGGNSKDVNLQDLQAEFFNLGDAPSVPASDPNSHGTGLQRQQSFTNGWTSGYTACGLPLR
jgi:hypothetical protein